MASLSESVRQQLEAAIQKAKNYVLSVYEKHRNDPSNYLVMQSALGVKTDILLTELSRILKE